MENKLLILGSNSFAATYFTGFALTQGCEVLCISRSEFVAPHFCPFKADQYPNQLSFYQGDINQDFNQVIQRIDQFKPSWVANFAAQGMVAQSWQNPLDWYQTNIMGSVRLVEFFKQTDYLDRFLQVSTPEVYGNQSTTMAPSHICLPSTPYAISKACLDDHLRISSLYQDFPALITRSANFYGPGQALYRLIPKAFLSFMSKTLFTLDGGGQSQRNFLHARDAAHGFFQAFKMGAIGGVYHFAGDELVSIRDLVEKISGHCGRSFEDSVTLGPDRLAKDPCYQLDTHSTRKALHWSPRISLEQGLSETYEWVKAEYATLSSLNWSYTHKV